MFTHRLLPLTHIAAPEGVKDAKCPFYGMTQVKIADALIDQNGNACALITSSSTPCAMEMSGDTPNFDSCGLCKGENAKMMIRRTLETCTVFSNGSTKGIPGLKWFKLMMGKDFA